MRSLEPQAGSNEGHVRIWEFFVHEGHEAEFEAVYGPRGAWATLFASGDGYLGTELLRDAANPRRFLTIDRWTTPEAFSRFHETHAAEYAALDVQCEPLTERETQLGVWLMADTRR